MNIPGSDVILNGELIPRNEAKVSVFDRGFIFGDSIYEVIPVYQKKPFFLDRHLNRMVNNLHKTGITNPLSKEEWEGVIQKLIEQQSFNNQKLYIQVSRGVAPRNHSFPQESQSTYLLFTDELNILSFAEVTKGTKVVTAEDFRWLRGDIKSTSLLAAVLSTELAYQSNASEVIFHRNNIITEGGSSNILVVIDNKLYSPVINNKILNGITLSVFSDLAKKINNPIIHRDINLTELFSAKEVMLISSGRELVPIVSIDNKKINDGNSGEVFKQLWHEYRNISGYSADNSQ